MAAKRVHRKTERSAHEKARVKALREAFLRERPSAAELAQSAEYLEPTTMGEFLDIKAIAHALKSIRLRENMTLADVAALTGMDRAAISRLENGIYQNTTINTINRLARAYGKRFAFRIEDDPELAR
jgi:DNA-binding Xre family transcriptional regulator